MNVDTQYIIEVAKKAGQAIMEIYEKTDGIQVKSKIDNSPLTNADIAAHETIISGLKSKFPDTPIISEEGNIGNPQKSEFSWLVDPLDGTKEFIKRNGMFTVNIALMKKDMDKWNPIIGVVHAPVLNKTWFGNTESDTAELIIKDNKPKIISVNKNIDNPIQLVASGGFSVGQVRPIFVTCLSITPNHATYIEMCNKAICSVTHEWQVAKFVMLLHSEQPDWL